MDRGEPQLTQWWSMVGLCLLNVQVSLDLFQPRFFYSFPHEKSLRILMDLAATFLFFFLNFMEFYTLRMCDPCQWHHHRIGRLWCPPGAVGRLLMPFGWKWFTPIFIALESSAFYLSTCLHLHKSPGNDLFSRGDHEIFGYLILTHMLPTGINQRPQYLHCRNQYWWKNSG